MRLLQGFIIELFATRKAILVDWERESFFHDKVIVESNKRLMEEMKDISGKNQTAKQ